MLKTARKVYLVYHQDLNEQIVWRESVSSRKMVDSMGLASGLHYGSLTEPGPSSMMGLCALGSSFDDHPMDLGQDLDVDWNMGPHLKASYGVVHCSSHAS